MLMLHQITKQYAKRGINNLSLTAEPGEVIGLVGPNGVGKSTLLQCMAGLVPLDSGSISYQGKPIAYPAPELMGYMPEFSALPDFLTPEGTLRYLLRMSGETAVDQRVAELLQTFAIAPFAHKPNGALSQGIKQCL